MKKLIALMFVLLPITSFAEYDAERIKREMTNEAMFAITDWKRNQTDNGWVAKHSLENTVITVGNEDAGIIFVLDGDELASINAMLNCIMFGYVGLDDENENIPQTVGNALADGNTHMITINDTRFKVSPEEVNNLVVLTCSVSPAI